MNDKMLIIEARCWKCGQPMKVAAMTGFRDGNSSWGPDNFTDDERKIAEDKGVIIQEQYSNTKGERYLANSCKSCGTFVGSSYLFTRYISPAEIGDLQKETILF